MIDIDQLRRLLNSTDMIDGIDLHANIKPIVRELLDRLEAAENDVALKERVIDALGSELNAVANERDDLLARIREMERQEPVAKVRVHRTGGNAGIAWSARPLNDFDSLPLLREGDRLYLAPGAQPAPSVPEFCPCCGNIMRACMCCSNEDCNAVTVTAEQAKYNKQHAIARKASGAAELTPEAKP